MADVIGDALLVDSATSPLAKAAWPSASSAAISGSTIDRHTDVFERVAGSVARLASQSDVSTAVDNGEIGDPRGRPAHQSMISPSRPAQRVEIVLERQHGTAILMVS